MSAKSTDPDKAFVLGLDGVPWYLLEDWIDEGELPNFAQLVEEGSAGPLESTKPPTTALAWPTIATGTWPDKHGVYAFHEVQSDYTNEMNTSHDLARPELWDVLSPAVVGNVPMTYPADDIDGQMVTGMMTPGFDGGFTHPPELADEILDEMPDYQIGLPWDEYHDDREGFLEDFETLVASQRGLLEKQMTVEDWQRMLAVNLTAPFLMIRAALPHLRATRGAIVNIGSIEGIGTNPNHAAYSASKAGLHGLTRSVAVDHGSEGIRCNAVAPGWIETELNARMVEASGDAQAFEAGLGRIHPVGRAGRAEEVAALVAFLAAEESGFITGQVYAVDGGRMVQLSLP